MTDQIKNQIKIRIKYILNKGQMNCNRNLLLIFITDTSSHLMSMKEKLLGGYSRRYRRLIAIPTTLTPLSWRR